MFTEEKLYKRTFVVASLNKSEVHAGRLFVSKNDRSTYAILKITQKWKGRKKEERKEKECRTIYRSQ